MAPKSAVGVDEAGASAGFAPNREGAAGASAGFAPNRDVEEEGAPAPAPAPAGLAPNSEGVEDELAAGFAPNSDGAAEDDDDDDESAGLAAPNRLEPPV